jgi:hypothetical protein
MRYKGTSCSKLWRPGLVKSKRRTSLLWHRFLQALHPYNGRLRTYVELLRLGLMLHVPILSFRVVMRALISLALAGLLVPVGCQTNPGQDADNTSSDLKFFEEVLTAASSKVQGASERVRAIRQFPHLGLYTRAAVPTLLRLLEEENGELVQEAAIRALGEIGDDAGAAYGRLSKLSNDSRFSMQASLAIAKLHERWNTSANIEKGLTSGNPEIRWESVLSLGRSYVASNPVPRDSK